MGEIYEQTAPCKIDCCSWQLRCVTQMRLYAQATPEAPAAGGTNVYLPAIQQAADGTAQTNVPPALMTDTVVRITYQKQGEVETLLAALDVFEESCGKNILVALVSPEEYRRLVAKLPGHA